MITNLISTQVLPIDINAGWQWAVYIVIAMIGGILLIAYKVWIPYLTKSSDLALSFKERKQEIELDRERDHNKLIASTSEFLNKATEGQQVNNETQRATKKTIEAMAQNLATHVGALENQSSVVEEMINLVRELVEAHKDHKIGYRFETIFLKHILQLAIQYRESGKLDSMADFDKFLVEVKNILKKSLQGMEIK